MTLRQRLREAAETDLDELIDRLQDDAADLIVQHPKILTKDLLKLAAGGRTDSVRTKVVTALTNQKEVELEKFFNKQQELPMSKPELKAKDK